MVLVNEVEVKDDVFEKELKEKDASVIDAGGLKTRLYRRQFPTKKE